MVFSSLNQRYDIIICVYWFEFFLRWAMWPMGLLFVINNRSQTKVILAPPPPNIVEYKTHLRLWENTQIYNLSLKSPPPNIWVRTQTKNLSKYSNYLRYLCTYFKFVLKHLIDHLCIHLYFSVDFILNLLIFLTSKLS